MKAKNHSQKFKRWQAKVCQQTQFLSKLTEQQIIPFFESIGFQRVDICLNDSERPVAMDSIELERIINDQIDSVDVSFAKYGEPKFQIGFSRREVSKPYKFIRSGCLVKKPSQYYFFWGKPWWCPLSFWSESNSIKIIDEIMPLLPQILEFLESGVRGKNISKEV